MKKKELTGSLSVLGIVFLADFKKLSKSRPKQKQLSCSTSSFFTTVSDIFYFSSFSVSRIS